MNTGALIQHVQRGTSHALFPGSAIAGLAIAILAGAYAFQYIGGLAPCPLCLEQRVPWFVLIAVGAATASAQAVQAPRPLLLTLYAAAAGVALWGAYLGLFHAGVEYKWWPGPADCAGTGLPLDGNLLAPLSQSQIVRCDEVPWSLLGISLAGFNFLFSLLAVAFAGLGAWNVWKEAR
jgi:disulfide bond formation protein DsbB